MTINAAGGSAVPVDDQGREIWELRLYVAGQTAKSLRAIDNLKRLCEDYADVDYKVEVIDLLQHPQLARGDEIIAVPTLVRTLPTPMRKIIGDLSDRARVLVGLQVRPSSGTAS